MKCFVIMPYGNREKDLHRKQELDSLYEHFIRPAVEAVAIPGRPEEHVLCHRGDKEPGPGEIVAHIVENLVLSELAIADLSGRNPNVFYELGVRHAVSHNTILISESEEDVPFDLRGQRLILYKRDFEGGARLRNEITKAVQDIVRAPGKIDNPVRRFLFDREREKLVEQAQGRPPGYDFVQELLQEMTNLRKEFKAQRMVQGQLLVPYCYNGDVSLDAHFFNFRRIADNIFARFQWLTNREFRGYLLVKIVSPDCLIGGWWFSEAVPKDVADDVTRMTGSIPGMHPYELRRVPNKPVPFWAQEYFQKHLVAKTPAG